MLGEAVTGLAKGPLVLDSYLASGPRSIWARSVITSARHDQWEALLLPEVDSGCLLCEGCCGAKQMAWPCRIVELPSSARLQPNVQAPLLPHGGAGLCRTPA